MKNGKFILIPILATFLVNVIAGCGGGGGGSGGRTPSASAVPAATSVGQSTGPAMTAVIGPAGGTLASADGKLSIAVPAGALAQDTTVGIEPITDMTRGGQGTAYRLTPHGENFAQPVTIVFTYGEADIAGTAPENLTLMFQRSDGIWQVADNLVVDPDVRTVTVQTMHFSDWVHVPEFLLEPGSAVVKVGETVQLQILDCINPLPDDESVEALVPGCFALHEGAYIITNGGDWSVNGFVGGDAAVGRIEPNGSDHTVATYTAPTVKPDINQVAVSVTFDSIPTGSQTKLVSNINVISDASTYTGTAHFLRSDLHATATVVWTKYDEGIDYSDYLGSGMIEGTLELPGCDALPFALAISSGTATDPASGMSVFNDIASPPYTNSHFFLIQPDPNLTLTLNCSGTEFQMPAAILQTSVGAICSSGAPRIYHADINHLSGTWSCASSDLIADWDFVRQ